VLCGTHASVHRRPDVNGFEQGRKWRSDRVAWTLASAMTRRGQMLRIERIGMTFTLNTRRQYLGGGNSTTADRTRVAIRHASSP
jgi:hypothetical protein